ncbi:hypothetical protein D7Z26_07115 [Cohnella endophytica]|uniref:Uncharacterized protein n=1 Tax=Cohnella endophytica TaxID=2419778 RepID=A0A494Y3Z0_9BACL|nr:hypothetical protein D7Z26_07115 [Cohnella endophytica]
MVHAAGYSDQVIRGDSYFDYNAVGIRLRQGCQLAVNCGFERKRYNPWPEGQNRSRISYSEKLILPHEVKYFEKNIVLNVGFRTYLFMVAIVLEHSAC